MFGGNRLRLFNWLRRPAYYVIASATIKLAYPVSRRLHPNGAFQLVRSSDCVRQPGSFFGFLPVSIYYYTPAYLSTTFYNFYNFLFIRDIVCQRAFFCAFEICPTCRKSINDVTQVFCQHCPVAILWAVDFLVVSAMCCIVVHNHSPVGCICFLQSSVPYLSQSSFQMWASNRKAVALRYGQSLQLQSTIILISTALLLQKTVTPYFR